MVCWLTHNGTYKPWVNGLNAVTAGWSQRRCRQRATFYLSKLISIEFIKMNHIKFNCRYFKYDYFLFQMNFCSVFHVSTLWYFRRWNFQNLVGNIFEFYEIIIPNGLSLKISYPHNLINQKYLQFINFEKFNCILFQNHKKCNESDFIFYNTAYFHHDGKH